MSAMPSAEEILLTRSGYGCRYTDAAWVECGVFGHGEVWLGRGLNRDAALENALAQMFPSVVARQLWVAARQRCAEEAVAPVEETPEEAVFVAEAPESPEPPESPESPESPPDDDDTFTPARVLSRGPETRSVAEAGADRPMPAALSIAPDLQAGLERVGPESVHATLDALTAEITEAFALDFGLYAADCMTLQLLAWAAAARDLCDRFPEPAVAKRVAGIISRLAQAGRTWWPGAVPAFRMDAVPASAQYALGRSSAPLDWHEVATLAEERLEGLIARRGDYGWSDESACDPPPRCPSSRFGDVRATLDRMLGTAGKNDLPTLRLRFQSLSVSDKGELCRAAQVLRWLRGTVDPTEWGTAMGRLRATVAAVDGTWKLAALEPEHQPPRTWAEMIVPASRPAAAPASALGLEPLRTWLVGVGSTLELSALRLALGSGHRELLASTALDTLLAGSQHASLRRRVRKLLKAEDPEVLASPDEDSAAAQLPLVDAEDTNTPREPTPFERARPLVAGRRALVVSNREDPPLQEALSSRFDLEIEWVSVDQTRLLASRAERVRSGAYGLVILVTGFMSHSHEHTMREAASAAGVKALRAAHGRPLAVALAILRDMGGAATAS